MLVLQEGVFERLQIFNLSHQKIQVSLSGSKASTRLSSGGPAGKIKAKKAKANIQPGTTRPGNSYRTRKICKDAQ